MRRGQLALLGIMFAIMAFITVVVFIEPIKDQVELARAPARLDCANSSITTSNQMACILVDTTLFGFVGTGIAVALGFFGIRQLRKRSEGE